MAIRDQVTNDIKDAMRAKDQFKLDAIRMLQSAIKYKEVELRPNPMGDDDVIAVVRKLVKQRQESIEQFNAAGRKELAEKEEKELAILQHYLPAQMSREDLEKIVVEAIKTTGATGAKQMGLVMKEVNAKAAGRADNKMVSEIVKAKLG
ncbi:MAG: GatB/YqeY domain-containing protein [Bdellovibrionales bacterium]|nr:GatB/YqeY domain-containing protein [Bdellovibrionales bacterium]